MPNLPMPISELIDRMLQIPEQYRIYTEDESAAVDVHKIPAELLDELLDHGLPHRRAEDGRLQLDRLDVENVGLALHLPSPRYIAMQRWRRILSAPRDHGHCDYRITIAATNVFGCQNRKSSRPELSDGGGTATLTATSSKRVEDGDGSRFSRPTPIGEVRYQHHTRGRRPIHIRAPRRVPVGPRLRMTLGRDASL